MNAMKNDPKGVYNRVFDFTIENYTYWKDWMYLHLMLVDLQLWVKIKDGPFIPKRIVDGV